MASYVLLNDQERFCRGELLFVIYLFIYLFILVDVRTRSCGIKVNLREYECTEDTPEFNNVRVHSPAQNGVLPQHGSRCWMSILLPGRASLP